MSAPPEIYSLLVPLSGHRLLVPRANVAEVAGWREPKPFENALPWLLGTINWEGEQIPLMSFEGASGGSVPTAGGRTRIVLLRALTDVLQTKLFGIVTQGFPQLVRVNAVVLSRDEDAQWPSTGPVLCQVKMVNQRPLIPDIEQLEQMLADALGADA